MRKEDGYIGARVVVGNIDTRKNVDGTIIDDACIHEEYDFLVEFDDYIAGHNGLGWGKSPGKSGHCLWFRAGDLTMIEEEADCVDIEISLSFEDLTE